MLKEEVSGGGTGGDDCIRVCDTCQSAPCTVYCRADSAYLCSGCDAQIHAANQVASRHERVWVCEACERAPAAFLCKADAASLCAACDAHIHSANPLARRHHRVPIIPLTGCLYGPPSSHPFGRAGSIMDTDDGFLAPEEDETIDEEDEDEAASWLLINPAKPNGQNNNGFLSGEVDEYLDLVECNSNTDNRYSEQCKQQQQQYNVPEKNYGCDSVVPVQFEGKDQQQFNFQLGIDYDATKPGYSYASVSHSVSVSSLDVGVVPESTITDITASHSRPPKGTIDLFSGPPIPVPTQLSPMDREARVMRYREKKKTRKFEKTIRYASRKAYAESRPRIRGRFAKRSDVEVEVDQMFPNALTADSGYGIVPSF